MSVVKLNDAGIQVRKIQLLLNSYVKPCPNLRGSGRFGPKTQEAVIAFQKSKGLVPDGVVGPKTLMALGLKPVLAPTQHIVSHCAPWMDIAIAELGVHEDSLPGHHNARIIEYHQTTVLKATDDETPWCSSFVNWVLVKAGKRGTNSARAKDWLDWGVEVTTPTSGVITVIKRKRAGFTHATGSVSGFHVGFFIYLAHSHLRLLGGNQHNQVQYSNFPFESYDI